MKSEELFTDFRGWGIDDTATHPFVGKQNYKSDWDTESIAMSQQRKEVRCLKQCCQDYPSTGLVTHWEQERIPLWYRDDL